MFGITLAKKPHNYKIIDEVVSRSAMPTSERNMKWLKKHGVTDIVNFRQSGSLYNGGREREAADKYGIRYHHIPTDVKHPSEKQVAHFLDIVEGVEKQGGKVHIHCRYGADRTGMYSWIYKQKHGLGEMVENEREMRQMGHESIELPSLINWIKDYLYKDWGGRKSL
ncbi:tyrosine-protein phosphatase [bacterium]|nr:tyrosine-protein phosphatase [bacterium]